MLRQVLEAVEAADGAVDLRALSRDLGVEPSALEGMIQHWVRKGLLADSGTEGDGDVRSGSVSGGCGTCDVACGGAADCPFVVRAPRTVGLVPRTHGPRRAARSGSEG